MMNPPNYLSPPTDITAWVEEAFLQPALAGLGADAAMLAPLRQVLTRQVVDLCLRGAAPDDPLPPGAPFVEAELLPLLREQSGRRLKAARTEQLGQFQALLTSYDGLLGKTGWVRDPDRHSWGSSKPRPVKDPLLAEVLVGLSISRRADKAAALRQALARTRGWARAAWAAVLAGDPLDTWLALLQDEADPVAYLERVIITGHALGAAPNGTPVTAALRQAFLSAMAAAVWLAPTAGQNPNNDDLPRDLLEADSPYYLGWRTWRTLIICLARASRLLGAEIPPLAESAQLPASPLREIFAALQLPQRMTAEDARALCVVCAPEAGAAQGQMDGAFWTLVNCYAGPFRRGGRPWRPENEWYLTLALPALRRVNLAQASVALASTADDQPGHVLSIDPALLPEWIAAFRALLETDQRALAPAAWIDAVLRFCDHGAHEGFLLEDAPRLLQEQDLWQETVGHLRQAIKGSSFLSSFLQSEDDDRRARYLKVLTLAQLPLTDLETFVDSAQYSLPITPLLKLGLKPERLLRAWQRWYAQGDADQNARTLQPLLSQGYTTIYALVIEALASASDAQPLTKAPPLVRCLYELPAGAWLDGLLAFATAPLHPQLRDALSRLARYSRHRAVRQRCLLALLAAKRAQT